jgi:hypothetical protein
MTNCWYLVITNMYRKRGSQISEEIQVLKMYACGVSIDALLNISVHFFIPPGRNSAGVLSSHIMCYLCTDSKKRAVSIFAVFLKFFLCEIRTVCLLPRIGIYLLSIASMARTTFENFISIYIQKKMLYSVNFFSRQFQAWHLSC